MRRAALLACTALFGVSLALPARAASVSAQPAQSTAAGRAIAAMATDPAHAPHLPHAQIEALLRQHVKYVFVLYQENRSFDSYYGSFPGVDGLFTQAPGKTPGFTQPIENTDGSMATISPFRIGPAQHAADLDDVDHSYARMLAKMDLHGTDAAMDRYALVEEMKYTPAGAKPPLKAKQYGELAMAYEDCDTIPFMWNLADRFAIFDQIFQTTIGPSTPNAIAMIAGQTGETQWVKHPDQATNAPAMAAKKTGVPVNNDSDPFWGSPEDKSGDGLPQNPRDKGGPQINQTYATLMLTLPGRSIYDDVSKDTNPVDDLADVRADVEEIVGQNKDATPWAWYQEGYAQAGHAAYVGHHNGPQYFGYVAHSAALRGDLHGLRGFFDDVSAKRLPASGGVFYVRGGFKAVSGLKPAFQDPAVQRNFQGDDDHPGYSDSELSDGLIAREVNAIAASPYWKNSAIIITYDESEGDYDHVPPRVVSNSPAGTAMRRGPRIPLILISPYARTHVVAHGTGDHNSVIKFIDELYGLTPLADLPDEASARVLGEQQLHQQNLGPEDDKVSDVSDLSEAFDPARLDGRAKPLPASYAMTPASAIGTLPHYGGKGCQAIGMVPTDVARGIHTTIPADFNPRPSTDPTASP